MKTAQEILDQFVPNSEYPAYFHESDILDAMEEYAKLRLEAVIKHKIEVVSLVEDGSILFKLNPIIRG